MIDVSQILASYDAKIAAARNKRLGLQAKPVDMGAHKRMPPPIDSAKARVIRLLLTGEAFGSTELAGIVAITATSVRAYLTEIVATLNAAGVPMEDYRRKGRFPGTLRILDLDAARAIFP